jgi:hypothetical protein
MPWQLDHHMNACRNKTQKKQTRRQKIDAKRFYTSPVGRPLGLRSRQSRLGDRWQRWAQLPDGIAVLERDRARRFTRVAQGESDLLGTLTRTQLIGGETDLPRLKEIQQSYKLQPLSKFLAVFQFFY